jgi:transposase
MLSEASQAIAKREYHALRLYSGAAPTTKQSGKKKMVLMRRGCNERLRDALSHWTGTSVVWDKASKRNYAQLRAQGHTDGSAMSSSGLNVSRTPGKRAYGTELNQNKRSSDP